MCDQYVKFCTNAFNTHFHSKNTFLRFFLLSPKRHGTNDINELTIYFWSHAKDMNVVYGNLSDESYTLSQKEYHEYVVLMTMNSESSSFQSTLYAQLWRYHGFKRPYVWTLQKVSIISVGVLGYLCILDRLLFSIQRMESHVRLQRCSRSWILQRT